MALTNRVLIAAAVLIASAAAVADEAPGVGTGTAANLKHLASDFGMMGTLLSMALAAIMALFGLYILERPKRETALAKQGEGHAKELADKVKELADKDSAHAQDRAEWHASTTLLQESRLALMREVLTAIERATSVMTATQSSINERTASAAQVVDQLSTLVQAVHGLRGNIADDMEQLRKTIRQQADELERLAKRSGQAP